MATIDRVRLWWRRAWRDHRLTVAFVGAVVTVLLTLAAGSWLRHGREPRLASSSSSSDPSLVDLTLVQNAAERGALCLDGSPPAYHLQRGHGSGSNSWILHIEGGGWCNTVESCNSRKRTPLGSSHFMERQTIFYGMLSHDPSRNPDFYNWNRVKIRYCDGASFSGNVGSEVQDGTKLFFRGQRIWEAIMDELKLKGLANAKEAFLTGCSAGGLATFIHCDNFRALMPKDITVKCLSDAGFFLDEKDISAKRTLKIFYNEVVNLHDVGKNFPINCMTRNQPSQCFFPHELVKGIKTPFFILNPAYDFWQIQHVLAPEASDRQGRWMRCKRSIEYCDSDQMKVLQGFRESMLGTLSEVQNNQNVGMFINSCFIHCQTMSDITWHSPKSPRINNKTIAEAVGDWYFNRREVKEIDCAYPCNPSCYNMDFN